MDLASALLWVTIRFAEAQQRPRIAETVVVMGSAASLATPAAVTTLAREALTTTPTVGVDDALRSVPGFSLFRRSSSRVANPTTQGATLRGLAASGSSRALVLADDVPLNDPVGGWVYWNRVPFAALEEVSVARGAAGDVQGADALAGVVSLQSARQGARMLLEAGSDATGRASGYVGRLRAGQWAFGAAEAFNTDGFVIVAPESRGPIDTRAASRHGSAHGGYGLIGESVVIFRGSYFREDRDNGTPFQRNGTDTFQASGSAARWKGMSGWSARAYGSAQHYEQTFSAVAPGRATEQPTSAQDVDAVTFGGGADWTYRSAAAGLALVGSVRTVDASLEDRSITAAGTGSPVRVEPRQTTAGVGARGTLHGEKISVGGGFRVEHWRTDSGSANEHTFVNPRVWLTYRAIQTTSVNVAVQSGYRGPTLNELYRPFRVGNVITQANADLEPERVRGVEAGVSWHRARTTMRVLGFWSRVDDAITNVTLSAGSTIVRQRQNAARIRARGVELELEARVSDAMVLTAASAYTDSIFTEGPLDRLRVPQVPRWHQSIGGRGAFGRAKWSAEWRFIDEQFDDDRNLFPLDESSMLDARFGWMLTRKIELFGAIENVLDEEQDVGRTPIRTIGLPRTSRVGVRVTF
jgi:outer membrane receptor protein involved in Fe transport